MKCADCGYENDEDARYCEKCGNLMPRLCPNCKSEVKPGASFCNQCGTRLIPLSQDQDRKERLSTLQQSAPTDLKEKIRTSSTQIEGERKPVTILFTDIVGSTAMAEKLDPEEWKEIVSAAHQRISLAVYKYEGTIAQLLGDGVLAFFGAPVTHEDDPIRAVHAALDIQQEIERYAVELKGYVENFQLRIGLNTGTVVVGNVGSDLHMEYLAIGDAVNLAARLQAVAQPGKVLISESTARHVKAVFDLQSMGNITVKGKSEPVTTFEVAGRKAVAESRRGFTELYSPIVGRGSELANLKELMNSLLNGHGQIVSIIGEAGIGKSRLVAEVHLQDPGRSAQVHWIEGRALSYGQALSFWTITQLLYSDLGLSDGDPEVKVRAALKRHLKAMLGEKDIELFPYLAHLLGIRLEGEGEERIRSLEGETLKRQTLVAIGQYIQRLAEQQPTVVVFEDLHWADPSSLEALEALLTVTDHAPLMLILLFRPEREHGSWQIKLKAETDFSHRYTEILLKPLSTSEQNRLVDNLLAIADLPEATRQLILERTEGNPFYLEEIIRSLIDQGVLVHEGESWKVTTDLSGISIPETLEGVLLARIDRLQEGVRHTLQLASVIGKSFLFRLLEAIATAERQLDQQLAQLQRVDLVREKNRLPELEYVFKHSLTQEAAYNSLLMEQRREFHNRVGAALEKLFADRIEQYLGLLAYHFEAAGDAIKAVSYLIRAGDQARLTDEHSEAISFYQRAARLLEDQQDDARLAQVLLKLGLIYNTNFQFEAAHQFNEKAFTLQQKILPQKPSIRVGNPQWFRFAFFGSHVTLDPGLSVWGQDVAAIIELFSGLARLDEEGDVLPAVARSWQVLDDGRRYIFHLRDDVRWTDGSQVTAEDFEWAWKRNLHPDLHSGAAGFLFDVVGAMEYAKGINRDSTTVGVRALDKLTLEVQLVQPVAYFPFIICQPVAFPLPKKVIDRVGSSWWQPATIVSNGPYRLEKFELQKGGTVIRNPDYYGAFPGNAECVEWTLYPDPAELIGAYQAGKFDFVYFGSRVVPKDMLPDEILENRLLGISYLVFNPKEAPFNDLRVRKAFGMSINRQSYYEEFGMPICRGGLVPPGMPGHSPDIGLPYDAALARQLMAEAGYPGGRGFPPVNGIVPQGGVERFAVLARSWQEILGVEVNVEGVDPAILSSWNEKGYSISFLVNGWSADYPDPDNFLAAIDAITHLRHFGWQDADYDRLIEQAARTPDRPKRMAMYRQADYKLVAEQVVMLPIFYFLERQLIKPWVKNYRQNLLGINYFYNLIIEDH